MPRSRSEGRFEVTYPLAAAARLTGLSPELLRAWERRHGVVRPLRTPGGTRRYRAEDLERLRLLKAAVDAGHRIGQVVGLDVEALERCARPPQGPRRDGPLEEILAALERLDGAEARRLLALQLSGLGAVAFAREVALPLVHEIGERWAARRLGIAPEHLATAVLRSLLGSALQPSDSCLRGPRIVFATPTGERHELGLQMAALTAMGAGANPIYLGPELPVEDLIEAVERTDANVLALSFVTLGGTPAARTATRLRAGLPDAVHCWIGGAAARGVPLPDGVARIGGLEELERRVALLSFEPQQGGSGGSR